MNIIVNRRTKTGDGILGTLKLDWSPFACFTAENLKDAIPAGVYTVEFTWSPEFNMIMPLIDVPNRTGIRIHAANFPCQLLGCIAVGDQQEVDAVDNSRVTFNQLNKIFNQKAGIKIQIVEDYAA